MIATREPNNLDTIPSISADKRDNTNTIERSCVNEAKGEQVVK